MENSTSTIVLGKAHTGEDAAPAFLTFSLVISPVQKAGDIGLSTQLTPLFTQVLRTCQCSWSPLYNSTFKNEILRFPWVSCLQTYLESYPARDHGTLSVETRNPLPANLPSPEP